MSVTWAGRRAQSADGALLRHEGCHTHGIPSRVDTEVVGDGFVVSVTGEGWPCAGYGKKDIDGGILIEGFEGLGVGGQRSLELGR